MNEAFSLTPSSKGMIRRLLHYMRSDRPFLILAVSSALATVATFLVSPILVGRAIDAMLGIGLVDFPALFKVILILLALYLLDSVFQWLLAFSTHVISFNTVRRLRTEAFAKIQSLPLSYLDRHTQGNIVARLVPDAEAISEGLSASLSSLLTGLATIAGTIGIMLYLDVFVALTVILITPLSIVVAWFITSRSHRMFSEQAAAQGELAGYVNEMVSGQKLVTAFSYADKAQERFEIFNQSLRKTGYKAQVYASLVNPSTRFVNNIVYAAVGVVGGLMAVRGSLTVGELSAFITYANRYTKPFNEISGVISQIQAALSAAARIFALLDAQDEVPDAIDARQIEHCEGNVTFENISFSYVPDRPLITDLNVSAKVGQKIAIVGPTGAGKTTIVNLLMRFYEPQAGKITLDGTDIRKLTRNSMRKQFGMVLQDSWLFSGTVRENLLYGKPDATEEEMVAAAKAAFSHNFIQRLPKGYDTEITDESSLSQGQKQLLCIARVMLTDPALLILDEATSAIDTLTEARISQAFDKMTEGRTSFVIAHRLSTIQGADLILVMQNGNIVEQGRHEELLSQNGLYAKLYYSQFAPTMT
ncbi:MAG TPA: ABC transporter ATP-binding protein [Clostridiales bacterium]|nr:ABC transporter ATP-binding protein [Clostridiales bacterium]